MPFFHLNHVVTSPPVLRHYNSDVPVELHTEASGDGLGTALSQRNDDAPIEHVIDYARRALRKECLVIVWAVGKLSLWPSI